MYHFVQYLYHFIFILVIMTLVVPCLHNMFMVLLHFALKNINIGATKPIFLDSGSPRGEGGFVRAWAWFVIIAQFIYYSQLNLSKNSIFFVSNSDLCRGMLPNYLRTYSSALCQIRALEKALKKQSNGQSVPKILVLMHSFDWPEQTLKIHIQYCSYFACDNDLCRGVLTNLLGDIFLSFLPHLSLEEGI